MFLNLYVKAKTMLHREDGAVATEYGLLLVFIALAIIAAVIVLGTILDGIFTDAGTELGGAGA